MEPQIAVHKKPHPILTVLAWIVLLMILMFGWLVWNSSYLSSLRPGSAVSTSLSGYLLIDAAAAGDPVEHPYILDASQRAMNPSPFSGFTATLSPDGNFIVDTGPIQRSPTNASGVFLYNLQNRQWSLFATSTTINPYLPQLSPNGREVVFKALLPGITTTASSTLSSWGIYLASRGGVPALIAKGSYPYWSPDGTQILYLGLDGLHTYTIASSTDTLIWPLSNGETGSGMIMTLAPNGHQIAWADPAHDQIMVANIASWSPFSISSSKIITAYAYWPVFSPDGTNLAFEEVDPDGVSNPRLTVYNLVSGRSQELYDFSSYDQSTLYITGWVSTLR